MGGPHRRQPAAANRGAMSDPKLPPNSRPRLEIDRKCDGHHNRIQPSCDGHHHYPTRTVLDSLVKTPPDQKKNLRGLAQEPEDQMQKAIIWSTITSTLFTFALGGFAGVIAVIG